MHLGDRKTPKTYRSQKTNDRSGKSYLGSSQLLKRTREKLLMKQSQNLLQLKFTREYIPPYWSSLEVSSLHDNSPQMISECHQYLHTTTPPPPHPLRPHATPHKHLYILHTTHIHILRTHMYTHTYTEYIF